MALSKLSIVVLVLCSLSSGAGVSNYMTLPHVAVAADNCDATSTCSNSDLGSGNSQNNNCSDFSTCTNSAVGSANSQSNECAKVGCSNDVNSFFGFETNGNTQLNHCSFAGNFFCSNSVTDGSRNSQTNNCTSNGEALCSNLAVFDRNNQKVDCMGVRACGNRAVGNENVQNLNCKDMGFGCFNSASGSDNSQTLQCEDSRVRVCGNSVGVQGDHNNMNMKCTTAVDECSNFVLEGNDNSQTMDCNSVGVAGCFNVVLGNGNTQTMSCRSVGDNGCRNDVLNLQTFQSSNDNTQHIDCNFVTGGCLNTARGDGNSQTLVCARMSDCSNTSDSPVGSNSQYTTCANSGTCVNNGTNTNVLANGADCRDHGVNTTTICQPGRTIVRSNT